MSNPCSYISQLPPEAYYQFRCVKDPGRELNDLLSSKYISMIDSIKYIYQEEIDEPTCRIISLRMVSSKLGQYLIHPSSSLEWLVELTFAVFQFCLAFVSWSSSLYCSATSSTTSTMIGGRTENS